MILDSIDIHEAKLCISHSMRILIFFADSNNNFKNYCMRNTSFENKDFKRFILFGEASTGLLCVSC